MCSKALQIQSTAAPYVYKLCKSDVLCTLLFTVVNCMYSLYSCWISAIHVCPVSTPCYMRGKVVLLYPRNLVRGFWKLLTDIQNKHIVAPFPKEPRAFQNSSRTKVKSICSRAACAVR